jgi:hypothetical protein
MREQTMSDQSPEGTRVDLRELATKICNVLLINYEPAIDVIVRVLASEAALALSPPSPPPTPHPMLLQAVANLQALMDEMRCYVNTHGPHDYQCWVDKLGTAIADLQEVKE